MRLRRLACLFTVAALTLAQGMTAAPSISGEEPERDEVEAKRIAEMFAAHNQARRDAGLKPLERNKKLTAAAEAHAREMADRREMTHKGKDGGRPADRVKKAGYDYHRVGENIAFGHRTPDETVKLWLESEVHRKNILGAYAEIGIGCAQAADGSIYWCVDFGLRKRGTR